MLSLFLYLNICENLLFLAFMWQVFDQSRRCLASIHDCGTLPCIMLALFQTVFHK